MRGLLLIDHGSRRREANAQLDDMAALVRARCPGVPLATAHLDVCAPTIADGVAALLAQGCTAIQVLLYFLSDGRHSHHDISQQMREALAGRPEVTWQVPAALGPDAVLADLLLSRAGIRPG